MSTAGVKTGPSKRSTRGKGPNRGQAKTKIVVRRLPANLPEHVFLDTIKNLVPEQSIDRPTTWVSGKVSKNPVKGNTFARAYIYFKSEKLAAEFRKAYHGHLFVDRNGNEGRAYVEFAPFQKIPREQRKPDAKQGTIEEDPDYIAFLQSLNAEPTEAEKEMKLSGTEQLLKESFLNPKSTPLLEDLRIQKAAAAAHAKSQSNKMSARQARQAGKAGISNASKAQITILANRNAKDAANGRAAQGPSGSGNKNQQTGQQQGAQGKKAPPTSAQDSAQGAKPKRERKRRDRASKRAANEAAAASNNNTSETAAPQITLLKPKPAADAPVPAMPGHSANGLSSSQGAHGPPHSGPRRGPHSQQQPQSQHQQQQQQQTGAFNQGSAKKDNGQQPPGAEGATARPGRTRRGGRGDRPKAESKAASGGAPLNTNGSSNNAGGGSGPNASMSGNNTPGGQGLGTSRPGRSRRGRGGAGQEGPAANAVKE
ncbi:hypothetical protein BGZ70_008934 [Mortierella alpina]|uniref:UPF3 domain-containing protein n=1 Tax=Mortierella alpina TaxID=64518 RepID=A0A9P6J2T3_MORAP|nr:hypothetical protein BGZ70_008934 [Mortierella alpina]